MRVKLKQAVISSGLRSWEIAFNLGINNSRFSGIISGREQATEEEAKKIAEALGIPQKHVMK